MKTQLLCTFVKKENLDKIVNIIITCNDILYDKIYIFSNKEDLNQLICTYNVEYIENFQEGIIDTISLHRKKQTNTLYTINAINEIVILLNDGSMDKNFPIPWENYSNSMLLTGDEGLKVIKTKLYKIIDV